MKQNLMKSLMMILVIAIMSSCGNTAKKVDEKQQVTQQSKL